MRLRRHRRTLVVWRPATGPVGWHGLPRPSPRKRIRRWFRTGLLLTILGVMRLAGGARTRWRPLLAGTVLTVAGVILRSGSAGVVLLPGLLLLIDALLRPDGPAADRRRRAVLERELKEYSTPAQRCDLEALLDQYPDRITAELRDILARQAVTGRY